MLVSDKYKLLFVHVPKTGGSFIRKMIQSVDHDCYEYKEHHSVLDQDGANRFSDYYKFAVVRNSYRLCASFYRFMTEKIQNISERQEPVGIIGLIEGQLTETKDSTPWQLSQISNSFPVQMDWFSKDGKIFVDDVFIYDEGLAIQLEDLKKLINFKGSLTNGGHEVGARFNYFGDYDFNYFGDYDWKKYYDPESIEYVTRICQKDIKHFNFKFS